MRRATSLGVNSNGCRPLLTEQDVPRASVATPGPSLYCQTGKAVVLNTVRKAKLDCIFATPGSRVRYWR